MHFIFPMTSLLCIDLYFCLCHFSFAPNNFIKISYSIGLLEVNYFRFYISEKKMSQFYLLCIQNSRLIRFFF